MNGVNCERDLQMLIDVWPSLPVVIRNAIAAMARAASNNQQCEDGRGMSE